MLQTLELKKFVEKTCMNYSRNISQTEHMDYSVKCFEATVTNWDFKTLPQVCSPFPLLVN